MISIITRAYNRLEYTVLCVRAVYELSQGSEYEHIIIEQGSTDGTREWLHSMEVEGFYKLKVKYNETNTGDAGGMKDGFDMISPKSDLIIQLDNDLIPIDENWLYFTESIFKDKKVGTLMYYREGVGHHLEMADEYDTDFAFRLFRMKKPHAMVFRVDLLKELNLWKTNEAIGWVKDVPNRLKAMGYEVLKTPDIRVWHADTTIDPVNGQGMRYKIYAKHRVKDSNYRNINYKEL